MSQSLTKLKSIYLKSYGGDPKSKKSKHLKSFSQIPGKGLLKSNKIENKQETVKKMPNEKISIKCDEDFIKLDHLGMRSTLARTGLLALQQRMIELEYAQAIKTPRNKIDEKNWRIIEEDRFEQLYEKYHVGRPVKF